LVEHRLFDYLIGFQQQRAPDGVAELEGHSR
jgi:hypothetical protein